LDRAITPEPEVGREKSRVGRRLVFVSGGAVAEGNHRGLALPIQLVIVLVAGAGSGVLAAIAMRDQAKAEVIAAVRQEQKQYLTQVEWQRWLVEREHEHHLIYRKLMDHLDRLEARMAARGR
jgi:hypothetical protein